MEQQSRMGNCSWTKTASASSWKFVEIVLKWRDVADCSRCMKQQQETPYQTITNGGQPRWLSTAISTDVEDDLSRFLEQMSATRRSSTWNILAPGYTDSGNENRQFYDI